MCTAMCLYVERDRPKKTKANSLVYRSRIKSAVELNTRHEDKKFVAFVQMKIKR